MGTAGTVRRGDGGSSVAGARTRVGPLRKPSRALVSWRSASDSTARRAPVASGFRRTASRRDIGPVQPTGEMGTAPRDIGPCGGFRGFALEAPSYRSFVR